MAETKTNAVRIVETHGCGYTLHTYPCREAVDGVTVDFDSHRVLRGGDVVELTAKEFALLETLIQNRNLALSRDKLLDLVWGYDYVGDTRTVDVHIQQLRKKLGFKDRINTVYKVGYRFDL